MNNSDLKNVQVSCMSTEPSFLQVVHTVFRGLDSLQSLKQCTESIYTELIDSKTGLVYASLLEFCDLAIQHQPQ